MKILICHISGNSFSTTLFFYLYILSLLPSFSKSYNVNHAVFMWLPWDFWCALYGLLAVPQGTWIAYSCKNPFFVSIFVILCRSWTYFFSLHGSAQVPLDITIILWFGLESNVKNSTRLHWRNGGSGTKVSINIRHAYKLKNIVHNYRLHQVNLRAEIQGYDMARGKNRPLVG